MSGNLMAWYVASFPSYGHFGSENSKVCWSSCDDIEFRCFFFGGLYVSYAKDLYVVSQNSCLLIIESQLMRHLIIRDINISGIERLFPFLLSGKLLSSICRYNFQFQVVAAIQQAVRSSGEFRLAVPLTVENIWQVTVSEVIQV